MLFLLKLNLLIQKRFPVIFVSLAFLFRIQGRERRQKSYISFLIMEETESSFKVTLTAAVWKVILLWQSLHGTYIFQQNLILDNRKGKDTFNSLQHFSGFWDDTVETVRGEYHTLRKIFQDVPNITSKASLPTALTTILHFGKLSLSYPESP